MSRRRKSKSGLEFSDLELQRFDVILKALKKKILDKGLTIHDEVYPDGYLISNDYKIWVFEIVECPNWLFGVWLTVGDDEDGKNEHCIMWLFAQHKEYIDKFKPFASALCVEEKIWVSDLDSKDGIDYEINEALKIVDFVKKQPYLAWYRDVHWTDFNVEYISPEEAKKDFEESEAERIEKERIQNELEAREMEWMKNYYDKTGYKYKITTDEYCFPKHSVIIEDKNTKPGCYGMLDEKEKAEFDKIYQEYRDKGFYLFSTFDDCAWFVKEFKK